MFIPNLQDPIRNYAYERFINKFHGLADENNPWSLLDVGTRDSKFPAFLNTLRYYDPVLAIDREDYGKTQKEISDAYGCSDFEFQQRDLLHIADKFDIITAVYALQHNVEKDIECYKRCATLANKYIYIVNEYNHKETKLHLGRNDGDMRIYSEADVENRIIKPITSVLKPSDVSIFYDKFIFETQHVGPATKETANSITLVIKI